MPISPYVSNNRCSPVSWPLRRARHRHRRPRVPRHDLIREPLEELERELGPIPDQPFEAFVPNDEELRLGDSDRGGVTWRVPEHRHLAQQLPSLHQVESAFAISLSLHDLDRACVNKVRLSARVVALLEDDHAWRVVTP